MSALLEDRQLIADVRRLSRISNFSAAAGIAQQWLIIAVVATAAIYLDQWWGYLAAAVIVATRQHALGVIMHDATHYRLFTSRAANEYVSNFCCAFPIGMSTQGYRDDHLPHHQLTNTPDDPYCRLFADDSAWHWPKSRGAAIRQLLADVTGWNTVRNFRMSHRWMPSTQWLKHRLNPALATRCRIDLFCSVFFWTSVLTAVTLLGAWKYFLLLWIVPITTFCPLFVRLRWISEHPYGHEAAGEHVTRHVHGTLLERATIAPLNINYHIAHHLFPAVPFYALPQVHDRLKQNPTYLYEAERFHDYLGSTDSIRAELIVPAARAA